MVLEMECAEGANSRSPSSNSVWAGIAADLYTPVSLKLDAPGAATAPGMASSTAPALESARQGQEPALSVLALDGNLSHGDLSAGMPGGDLSRTELKIADAMTAALDSKDRKAIGDIIEKYAEWPRALARIIQHVNEKYRADKAGTVISFSYYERSNIIFPEGSRPRGGGEAAETGFLKYHFASWKDPEPKGDRRPYKQPMRIYEKTPSRTIRTSAYSDKANDVTEPLKFNREDMGESLPPF